MRRTAFSSYSTTANQQQQAGPASGAASGAAQSAAEEHGEQGGPPKVGAPSVMQMPKPKRMKGESGASFLRRLQTWQESRNKQIMRSFTPISKSRSGSRSQTPKKSKLRQCPRKDREGKPNPCGSKGSGSRASKCKGCGVPFASLDRKRASVVQERYRKKQRVKAVLKIDWANASPQRKLEFLEQNAEKCTICQEPLRTREFVNVCECGHKMHKNCAKQWAEKLLEKSFPVYLDNPHSINSVGVNDQNSQRSHFGKFQCPSYCQKWQCFPVFEGDGTTPSRDARKLEEMERPFDGPPMSLWDVHFAKSQKLRKDTIEYNQLVVRCEERGIILEHSSYQDIASAAQMHHLSPLDFLRRSITQADEIEEQQRLAFIIKKDALLQEKTLGLGIKETGGILIVESVKERSLAAKVGLVPNMVISQLKMETATESGRVTHVMSPRTVQEVQSFLTNFKNDTNAVQFTITSHSRLV